jgi:hypothetical protein
MRVILTALLAGLLSLGWSEARAQSDWVGVTREQSKLLIADSALLSASGVQMVRSNAPVSGGERHLLRLIDRNRRLEAFYGTAGTTHGWHGSVLSDRAAWVGSWSFLTQNGHSLGAERKVRSPIGGRIDTVRVVSRDRQCFVWHSGWGSVDMVGGNGVNQRFTGYYCAAPNEPLSDADIDAIVASVGIRGVGTPPGRPTA